MIVKCTKSGGGVWLGRKYGVLAAGETIEVDPADADSIDSEGVKLIGERLPAAAPFEPEPEESESDDTSSEELEFLAGFPDKLNKDQAEDIAGWFGVPDVEFGEALRANEIAGAFKNGTHNAAPWVIEKAGLLAWLRARRAAAE